MSSLKSIFPKEFIALINKVFVNMTYGNQG